MDIIAMAVALKKAISQTKDIIASHFVAGTNIEITDNFDGTQTISASGEVSATDEVARQAISDHAADVNNPHSVTKNQIGLGNVDNTSDIDKPISTAAQAALNGKQPTINSSNPLSSDLVDDTNSTNKFVTEADKTTWNGKQDALTFDNVPTSESTNPVTSGGVYTALGDKQDIISDLSTIRSNATAGAGAATVVQGIDESGNNYIEMKSGQREYLSTTVPTGNIPLGSVGMGWAEGVYTFKSGIKVSEGELTANLTTTRNFVNSTTDTRSYFQARLFSGQVANNQKIDSTGRKNLSIVLPAGEHTLRLRHSGANTDISILTYSVVLTEETAFNCSFDVVGYNSSTVGGLVLDNIMLNEGSTPLPYVPYGAKEISFYANGQPLADYTIYGNDGGVGDEVTDSESAHYGEYDISVICGNTTTHIYLASPLGANDSIDYTTSQVAIPTVDGENTFICDTTVQPSKVSLTYTGWYSDLDDTTARIEALENAPAPSGGMTYDTLYEGTTASSYPYPLSHPITDYKFIIIAVGYSGVYTTAIVPVAVWSTITGGGNNYDVTIDTAQLRINASEIVPRSANNRIVYGVYGVK